MKKHLQIPILFLVLGFVLFSSFSETTNNQTQRIERHIIMFKITETLDAQKVQALDAAMSSKDGILASRTNPSNNVYFCYTLKSKDLTEANFKKWLKELGYEFTCFDKVVEGQGISKSFDEFENC